MRVNPAAKLEWVCFASHCDARQRSAAKGSDLASHKSLRNAGQLLTVHKEERCHTQTGQQLYAVDASLARRSRHAQLDIKADR